MIDEGLRALLLQQNSLQVLLGTQTVGKPTFEKVFNEDAPQGIEPPYIVISQISFDPMKALDGTTGMESTEFDIDCYHKTQPEAKRLGKAVSDFLKDYTGLAGGNDRINAVLWDNMRYDRFFNQDGSDSRIRICSLTFTIQHTAL